LGGGVGHFSSTDTFSHLSSRSEEPEQGEGEDEDDEETLAKGGERLGEAEEDIVVVVAVEEGFVVVAVAS